MRIWQLSAPLLILLCLVGCAQKKPKVDPVSKEMKKAVAGSAARVKANGVDWEVDQSTGEYWINATLKNQGGAGKVAVRGAIKVMLPYVGIGEGASKPLYLDLAAGQEWPIRIDGKVPANRADKAMGYVLEIYPAAGPNQ
jgi:hypothetical protein